MGLPLFCSLPRVPTAQSDGISFFFQKLGAPEEQAIETAEHLAAEHGLYSAGELKQAAAGCGEDLLEEADREQCAPTAPCPNPLPVDGDLPCGPRRPVC